MLIKEHISGTLNFTPIPILHSYLQNNAGLRKLILITAAAQPSAIGPVSHFLNVRETKRKQLETNGHLG